MNAEALGSATLCSAVNLTRRFEHGGEVVTPVRHLNLDVRAGDFVLIGGASGVGKSTLLLLLGGLLRPTEGDVLYRGRAASSMSDGELTA